MISLILSKISRFFDFNKKNKRYLLFQQQIYDIVNFNNKLMIFLISQNIDDLTIDKKV